MCVYIYIYIHIMFKRERSTIAPWLVCSLFRVVAGSDFCDLASEACSRCCVLTGSGVYGGGATCWGASARGATDVMPRQVTGVTDAIGVSLGPGTVNWVRSNGGIVSGTSTLLDVLAGDNDVTRTGEEALVGDAVAISGRSR